MLACGWQKRMQSDPVVRALCKASHASSNALGHCQQLEEAIIPLLGPKRDGSNQDRDAHLLTNPTTPPLPDKHTLSAHMHTHILGLSQHQNFHRLALLVKFLSISVPRDYNYYSMHNKYILVFFVSAGLNIIGLTTETKLKYRI